MVSGAESWRWLHDPYRSGLAARSAVAAVTVPVWDTLQRRHAVTCGACKVPGQDTAAA